jgi:heterodisulfide reductase subunit D
VAQEVMEDDLFESSLGLVERVLDTPIAEKIKSCIQCGTCSASCPTAYAMDYTPRQLWRLMLWGLEEEVLNSRTFWLCTTCACCTVRCPRGILLTDTMLALKSYALKRGANVPETILKMGETVTTNYNISGDENETRLIWSENLERVPEGIEAKKGAEVLYFVGCVSSFYPRTYPIPQALVQVLEGAGVDFTTLGREEWCCGYPLYAAGMKEGIPKLARHNVEKVRELGPARLVTTCPSCYYAWKDIYPQFVELPADLEILHSTEYLAQLIEDGRIELGPVERVVTYHDPCDLGRKSGIYEPPRFILERIPGLEFREMANFRESAICCGGGGDVEISDHEVTLGVGGHRVAQAQETGATAIVSACQQCERTLANAARQSRVRIKAMDVAELVWEAMN